MTQAGLFLDFDNTMMGTEKFALPSLIDRFNQLYASQTDHPLTLGEFKKHFHGQARETLCANLSAHFGVAVSYPDLYADREWRMMQHLQGLEGGVPMAPHLIEALDEVKSGTLLAFVSNNPVQRALAAMRYADNGRGDELAGLFGTRYFEAGDRQKPLPDVFLRAMEQVRISPEDAAAVEDSVSGIKSALAAKMKVYAYTGFTDQPEEAAKKAMDLGCAGVFHDWKSFPAMYRARRAGP